MALATAERSSGTIGLITLDEKCAGARNAGNPHVACDEAGAGNGLTEWLVRHSQRKQGATDRPGLQSSAPVLDPTRSQFTSDDFTAVLKSAGVKISMDGKGRWMDNIFIERLWRSLKYECIYLRDLETGFQARQEIGIWIKYYNEERPHSAFDGKTPMEVYNERMAA